MVDSAVLNTTSYLEDIAQGKGYSEFEVLILHGLELIHVGKGILRCKLLVTDRVVGEDGTWHPGAMATVMDAIGASAVYSAGEGLHSSVELNSSFYSTAKIQEIVEIVEIEARVNGSNGGLKSAVIEITRQGGSRQILATGRLWMAPLSVKAKHIASTLSKL